MIETLIERTNTVEFYQDSDLKLLSYSFNPSSRKCEFIFSINQISYDIPIEYEEWKITGENTIEIEGFSCEILLPYVKMEIIENHPLLWEHNEKKFECKLKGIPENFEQFFGDLFLQFEDKTGNWITINDYFWNNRENYERYNERMIIIPESIVSIFEIAAKRNNVDFKVIKENFDDENENLYKILFFGNCDVSPNDFSLRQHYIIAENFIGERIK